MSSVDSRGPTGMLDGKRLLLTGGAAGIGRATVERVIAEGASLAVFDRDPDVFDHEPAGAFCLQVDVSSAPEVERAVDEAHARLGGIDALIHLAGVMRGQAVPIAELSDQVWADVISVNLTGAYLMTKHVCRHMVPAGAGVVILAASQAGVVAPSGSIAYGASKGGVHGLSLTLAAQLATDGIRVHAVCPDLVDTPLLQRSIGEGSERAPERYEPLRTQVAPPEGIADVIAFLASDQASHLSGAVFTS